MPDVFLPCLNKGDDDVPGTEQQVFGVGGGGGGGG